MLWKETASIHPSPHPSKQSFPQAFGPSLRCWKSYFVGPRSGWGLEAFAPLFPDSPPAAPFGLKMLDAGEECDRRPVEARHQQSVKDWWRIGLQPPAAPHWDTGIPGRRRVVGITLVKAWSQDGASCNGWHVPRPQAVSFAGSCGYLRINQQRPIIAFLG